MRASAYSDEMGIMEIGARAGLEVKRAMGVDCLAIVDFTNVRMNLNDSCDPEFPNRPYLVVQGDVKGVVSMDEGAFPFGVSAYDYPEERRPSMWMRYDFNHDQLKDLMDKGLFTGRFDVPEALRHGRDIEIPCSVDVASFQDPQSGIPVSVAWISDLTSMRHDVVSCGYDLVEVFPEVPEVAEPIPDGAPHAPEKSLVRARETPSVPRKEVITDVSEVVYVAAPDDEADRIVEAAERRKRRVREIAMGPQGAQAETEREGQEAEKAPEAPPVEKDVPAQNVEPEEARVELREEAERDAEAFLADERAQEMNLSDIIASAIGAAVPSGTVEVPDGTFGPNGAKAEAQKDVAEEHDGKGPGPDPAVGPSAEGSDGHNAEPEPEPEPEPEGAEFDPDTAPVRTAPVAHGAPQSDLWKGLDI